jgi:hypothetical protein
MLSFVDLMKGLFIQPEELKYSNFIEYFRLYTVGIGKIKSNVETFELKDLYLRKFYYSDNTAGN